MRAALGRERFRQRILVFPQSDLLTDTNGKILVDYVGQYEDLQNSYDHICKQLKLPTQQLESKNRSEHKAYASYYDDALQESVADFYKSDFDIFGYNSWENLN